jgi:DNA damage-binding protein 1
MQLDVAQDGEVPDVHELLVLGTCFVKDDEDDPSSGRLLVFRATGVGGQGGQKGASASASSAAAEGASLTLVAAEDTRGGVFSLENVCGRIAVGINSRVAVFRAMIADGAAPVPGAGAAASSSSSSSSSSASAAAAATEASVSAGMPYALTAECSFGGNIITLHLRAAGGVGVDASDGSSPLSGAFADIAVGDLIKSISLLRYSKDDKTLVEIARDASSNWMTGVDCLAPNLFIGADSSFNLFTLARNTAGVTDEDRAFMHLSGSFHLGDQVNAFRKGSLVMTAPSDPSELTAAAEDDSAADDAAAAASSSSASSASASASSAGAAAKAKTIVVDVPRPKLLFGTVSGAIGAIITLPPPFYHFLRLLQTAMDAALPGVGGLRHFKWRSWQSAQLPYESFAPDTASGFIDGDLIERLLELGEDKVETIAATMNATPSVPGASLHKDGQDRGPATAQQLLDAVRELARLH